MSRSISNISRLRHSRRTSYVRLFVLGLAFIAAMIAGGASAQDCDDRSPGNCVGPPPQSILPPLPFPPLPFPPFPFPPTGNAPPSQPSEQAEPARPDDMEVAVDPAVSS